MEYRILGPLEVAGAGSQVVLGGGRQRSLLALLLLHANEVVSSDRLIDELWGDVAACDRGQDRPGLRLPAAQGAARRRRPRARSSRVGTATSCSVEPGELDLERFERALADGRRALDAAAPEQAADMLRDGLALWRGSPLADFAYEPFAQAEIARLEELRLAAVEERVEADLELGRHAEVVGELEALVAEHPLRERLRGQLMLALYRCERQADALAVYRQGRHRLVEELGLEPSRTLRRLRRRHPRPGPGLAAPPRAATATPRPRAPSAAAVRAARARSCSPASRCWRAPRRSGRPGAARRPGPASAASPRDVQRARRGRARAGPSRRRCASGRGSAGGRRRPRVGGRRRLAHRLGDRRPHASPSCAPCPPGSSPGRRRRRRVGLGGRRRAPPRARIDARYGRVRQDRALERRPARAPTASASTRRRSRSALARLDHRRHPRSPGEPEHDQA